MLNVLYWIIIALLCLKVIGNISLPYRTLRLKADEGISIGFYILFDIALFALSILFSLVFGNIGILSDFGSAVRWVGGLILASYLHYFAVLVISDFIRRSKK